MYLFLTLVLLFSSLCLEATPFLSKKSSTSFVRADSDHLHFGYLWKTIRSQTQGEELYSLIRTRRQEIAALKEHWRPLISERWTSSPFYAELMQTFYSGTLERIEEGLGSAYLLRDAIGMPRFVIKPVDEDILCLNNYKNFASPFNDFSSRVRDGIPLYRSAQTDRAAYETARALGLGEITPVTIMAILSHPLFYDICDVPLSAPAEIGTADREKLCSVQHFVTGSLDLFDTVDQWQNEGLSNEEIAGRIDQADFENSILFVWVIYDADAHAGNVRITPKEGGLFGLSKIDNGLSFPEENRAFLNTFTTFPNASKPLSLCAKNLIRNIPQERIERILHEYEMSAAVGAFKERIEVLQKLIDHESLTIAELDFRMHLLELPGGKELALSPLSQEELEKKLEERGEEENI